MTIVGSATFAGNDSPGGASVTLFTPAAAQRLLTGEGKVDAINVAAVDGVDRSRSSQHDLRQVLPEGVEVLTGDRDHRRAAGRTSPRT